MLAVALNRVAAIFLAPFTVPEIALDTKKKSKKKKISARLKNFSSPIKTRCLFGCLEASAAVAETTGCPDGCDVGETCQDNSCVPITATDTSSLPVKSDLSAKLLGAMVAGNPDFSTALISSGDQTYVVGVGEKILDAEIVEIRRDRIIVKRNGRLEYLKLENTIGGNPTLADASTAGLSRGAMDLKPAGYADLRPSIPKKISTTKSKKAPGIKKLSATEFELEKTFLDKELADTGKLASQASIAPNYDATGVKRAGIKMMGIRSGSVFQQLGIQSNDVVKKIGGTPVQNQAHALDLLNKLKGKSSASIEVERKGASKVLKYKVKK